MSKIIVPGHPDFYINRKRYRETVGESRFGVCGFFSGRAIHPEHGVMREFGVEIPNPNLLTDTGLDALGAGAHFTYMHLGTGTTPPATTDTGLANWGLNIGFAPAVTSGNSGGAPYYGWARRTWTSSVGGATGNWTEIGVGNAATNTGMRSRALILDGGGNPTAFPVLADEQFQGTYEFRIYAPESDIPAEVELSGTPYDTITRALSVTSTSWWAPNISGGSAIGMIENFQTQSYTGGLAAVTATNPLGSTLGQPGAPGSATYVAGTHRRDAWVRWGSGQGVGNIRTIMLRLSSGMGSVQCEYTPAVAKLTTQEFIHWQRTSWARR